MQVDVMKASVATRVTAFSQSLQRFAGRWEAVRPKDTALGDRTAATSAIVVIKERRTEFDELALEFEALVGDCTHFGVDVPSSESIDLLRDNIAQTEAVWTVYEEVFRPGLF
jgi:hypothetical protein